MYFGLEEAFFKAKFRRIKDKAARAHRKMVALEGFLWLSAGHFGGGKRIEEEEKGLERKRDDWRGGEGGGGGSEGGWRRMGPGCRWHRVPAIPADRGVRPTAVAV